jgi:asparaginyl-tRNA synthetase
MLEPIERSRIVRLLQSQTPVADVLVKGWVRTQRKAKRFSFLEVNDGSCLTNIQIIVDAGIDDYPSISRLLTGSAVAVRGQLVSSQGSGQQWEIQASSVTVIGTAPDDFPLQKKRHTDEFLRTIAHLRPRTNKYGAAFRIRSELAFAIHQFYHQLGFNYLHTPLLTGSDCEGAGEMFQVTTLNLEELATGGGTVDYSDDFFGKMANLTVSGQLEAEMFALALGDVYTFGPTFRAENSNTSRHVAEFWMVEPEMAFCDLTGNMDHAETLLKTLISHAMDNCGEDLGLFARFVDKKLMATLEGIVSAEFVRLPYREAVAIIEKAAHRFEYPLAFGSDLQSEHERYLTEQVFNKPVIVIDYPKTIKPFYMRLNSDRETVAAMDVLVPRIGEIIGGSQREERLEVLTERMRDARLPESDYWWYLEARRFGSVPHSGFGLGFERLMMLVTGIANIRDVIPFPRTPKSIDF